MVAEVVSFIFKRLLNRNFIINLLLWPAFDTEKAKFQWINIALKQLQSIRALIHQINFSHHANSSIAFWVNFSGNLKCIRISYVLVGRGEREDKGILRRNVLQCQFLYLLLNVVRLPLDRHPRHAGQVHQSQINELLWINSQLNRGVRYAFLSACDLLSPGSNFITHVVKIKELIVGSVRKLSVVALPLINLIGQVTFLQAPQLQYERTPRDYPWSSGQKVHANDAFEDGGLARALTTDHDNLR